MFFFFSMIVSHPYVEKRKQSSSHLKSYTVDTKNRLPRHQHQPDRTVLETQIHTPIAVISRKHRNTKISMSAQEYQNKDH